ncbi:hypothetical protein DH2020_001303 [Rehmannia glutinosa]|uniref:Rho termination factor-like N-terminal domain-containing protein n=1 Tax=Rehmannia glutinosa TaxID=99300 RepID=A0ABR0XZ97_REHGL
MLFLRIAGSVPPDDRYLPCSGVSGKALGISPISSHGDHKLFSNVKFLYSRCTSRYILSVCNASSSNYRRNPDSSWQNKRKFSHNRNRHNEERDGYEDLEESDSFSSRNGPLLSVYGNQKSQATATPGPKEKEIVELFRKVQAQLRERAATKEGKKVEDSQGKSKESETVDSLLKLLRKHSVQQGQKTNISANNRDFILDQQEQISISDSTDHVKHEIQESPRPLLSRPKSSFRKRSPVPEIKFQPIYSDGSVRSISHDDLDSERKQAGLVPEAVDIHEGRSDSESDVDTLFSEGNELDEISEDENSEFYENEHDGVAEEQNLVEASDLSGMKLTELRAVAKSRGMKGYSKLKKNELIELLNGPV